MSEWIGRGRLVHIYLDEMDRVYFEVADRAQAAIEAHWNRVDGNAPSDALCGDLSHQTPGSGASGRDGQDGGR